MNDEQLIVSVGVLTCAVFALGFLAGWAAREDQE